MLKRVYGNRSNWKRVVERDYKQTFHHDKDFIGHITLLNIRKVSEPLFVKYQGKNVCIVNDSYSWLQQFPIGKNHSVTTMFDAKGEVVQWYIDICHEIGTENNIPWMDDLFLDIVVLPTGEIMLLDEDELEEALSKGVIEKSLYDLAWKEAKEIINLVNDGRFGLLNLAKIHKEIASGS